VVVSGTNTLGQLVGSIAKGRPCQSNYRVGTNYYRITNSDVTMAHVTPRSSALVAKCAIS
jgi:hypothetical protein